LEEVYPVAKFSASIYEAWIEFNDEFFTNADPYTTTFSEYKKVFTAEFGDAALSIQSTMLGLATRHYVQHFGFTGF